MKFQDYIKGGRKGREAQRIEMEAMRDPLLHDAVEGYDRVPGDHDAVLERLRERIAERASPVGGKASARRELSDRRNGRMRRWSVAAAVVVMASVMGGGLLYLRNAVQEDRMLSQDTHKTVKEPSETAMPPLNVVRDESERSRGDVEEIKKESEPVGQQERHDEKIAASSDYINVVKGEAEVITDYSFDEFSAEDFSFDEDKLPVLAFELSEPPAPAEPDVKLQDDIAKQLAGRAAGVMAKESKSRPAKPALRGRVVEAGTGEPLAGASVIAEGSKSGAITGADGSFILPDAKSDAKLSASFLGYETATMPADTGAVMLIAMAPSRTALEEVVVVGYGTQKKTGLTGSVASASIPAHAPADTTTTPQFRRYLAGEVAKFAAGGGPGGSATLEFEVNELGRPIRIKTAESSSPEARREALRILRGGPDWEPSEGKRRVAIVFRGE